MTSRLSALVIWAAVAASLAYWGLRWLSNPIPVPAIAMPVGMESGAQGDFRRLLSGPVSTTPDAIVEQAPTALSGRLQLVGAFASSHAHDPAGVALISVDGQPARAYRVGTTIEGDWMLTSVDAQGAHIGTRGQRAALTLPLPTLPAVSTGALPPPTGITVNEG